MHLLHANFPNTRKEQMITNEESNREYYRRIRMKKYNYESRAEMGLHLWPRYPESMGNMPIGELLKWIRGMRHNTIKRMLIECGAKREQLLSDLTEHQRKWIADELVTSLYRKQKRNQHS